MDWDQAVERNREPLLGAVAKLFARIGLTEGAIVERVPKPLYRFMLGRLRAAEAAVRRLIYVAARNIVVESREPRTVRPRAKAPDKAKVKTDGEAKAKKPRRFRFRLFDPPKRLKKLLGRRRKRPRVEPRAYYVDIEGDPRNPIGLIFRKPLHPPAPPPVAEKKPDDGMVDARHLVRRLIALAEALQDIPRQALRLARWQARPVEERRPERWSPLRPGRPPGYRQRPKDEVDEILKECHWLALNCQPQLDTS